MGSEYVLHRKVTAADAPPYTEARKAKNCSESEYVNIQIVVGAGDSVTAKVHSWCEEQSKFVPIDDDSTYGPYTSSAEFTYFANGRRIFVVLTGTVTNSSVYIANPNF